MNTETKSADTLARELAELCAGKLSEAYEIGNFVIENDFDDASQADISKIVIDSTKLRELCACVEALREAEEFMEHTACCPARQNEEWPGIGHCNCGLTEFRIKREQALAALDGGGK